MAGGKDRTEIRRPGQHCFGLEEEKRAPQSISPGDDKWNA